MEHVRTEGRTEEETRPEVVRELVEGDLAVGAVDEEAAEVLLHPLDGDPRGPGGGGGAACPGRGREAQADADPDPDPERRHHHALPLHGGLAGGRAALRPATAIDTIRSNDGGGATEIKRSGRGGAWRERMEEKNELARGVAWSAAGNGWWRVGCQRGEQERWREGEAERKCRASARCRS